MTDLVEKVARGLHDDDSVTEWKSDSDDAEWYRNLSRTAIAIALEEAAKVVEASIAKLDDVSGFRIQYDGIGKNNHILECKAAAIRNLAPK